MRQKKQKTKNKPKTAPKQSQYLYGSFFITVTFVERPMDRVSQGEGKKKPTQIGMWSCCFRVNGNKNKNKEKKNKEALKQKSSRIQGQRRP